MQIEIPFTNWSKKRILQNKKRCTSKHYQLGEVGDTFHVDGEKFRIIRIEYLSLGVVRDSLFRCEGTNSPEQFERIWKSQHKIWNFEEKNKIFVHFFEKDEVR